MPSDPRPAAPPPDPKIDHLVYAVPDLEAGCAAIERELGIRPALGGRHPHHGSRNALLSLGATVYLEIIAPDPTLERPEQGRVFGLDDVREPTLRTWVLRSSEIPATVTAARSIGLDLGSVESGHREAPDGTIVAWSVSDPYAMPFDGAVPFLIDWGTTTHPATTAPPAGELTGFRIEHPEPDRVGVALAALGVTVEISRAAAPRLVAELRTLDGRSVELT